MIYYLLFLLFSFLASLQKVLLIDMLLTFNSFHGIFFEYIFWDSFYGLKYLASLLYPFLGFEIRNCIIGRRERSNTRILLQVFQKPRQHSFLS